MIRRRKLSRFLSGLGALVLLTGITAQVFLPGKVFAATQSIPTPRSLTLEAGATNGGSDPGGTVRHLFNFQVDGNATASYNVGSISFQYCTTADAVTGGIGCYVPPGLSLTSAAISNETGGITGFNPPVLSANEDAGDPNNGINNTMTIELSSAVSVSAATTVAEEFSNVVNPDNTNCYGGTTPASNNCTFYVRIYVYAGTGGGTVYDNTVSSTTTAEGYGVVTASTATPINLTGFMPESLTFCTGGTISTNAGNVPDCSTATSGSINFDRLFSPTDTAQATSQMAASTNANNGYAITVNGTTLTDGSSDTIAAMNTTGYSVQGTPQFGMNVVKNAYFCGITPTECDLGANVTSTGGSLYNGEATANYATGGGNCATATPTAPVTQCAQFTYNSGATVADSLLGNNGTGASDAQIYTDSYIVNVPGSQPAGTYVTTLTYICTPTY